VARAWLTPDTPAPNDERCRRVSVPNDLAFVAAVTGALLPLTRPENWEQAGSMSSQEAAEIMSAAFESFVVSDCEGEDCPPPTIPNTNHPFIRRNPSTGATEQWDGEEWIPPEGDYAIPGAIEREEETTLERVCAASVSAAGVLKELYVAMLDFYADEVDPYLNAAEFALQAGVLIGSSFGNISAAYVALLDFAFSTFVQAMDELTVPMWTDQWQQNLICILKDNATDTDNVITFNWSGVMADLVGLIVPIIDGNILVRWQTWYIVQFLGPEALNFAATKEGYSGDCADCGTWCFEFDFTQGSYDWRAVRETSGVYSAGGAYNGGQWVGTTQVSPGPVYDTTVCIGRTWAATTLNGFEVTYNRTNGQFIAQLYAQRIYLGNTDAGGTLGNKQVLSSLLSPGPAGTGLTISGTGTWTNAQAISVSLTAAYRWTTPPSPAGSVAITKIKLWGTGDNPFGGSNCP